jgi:hypothetical protein
MIISVNDLWKSFLAKSFLLQVWYILHLRVIRFKLLHAKSPRKNNILSSTNSKTNIKTELTVDQLETNLSLTSGSLNWR